MTIEEVEKIVKETIAGLPVEFRDQMDNVALIVEAWPTNQELQSIDISHTSLLFGLYRGIPKTKRTIYYSSPADKITIFAGPILAASQNLEDAKRRIKDTVLHEIGHHFGMSDEQLRKHLL